MNAKPALLVLAILTGSSPTLAKAPAPASAPVPIGSPGDWIGSSDYPATALRYEMTGVTAFRLTVDEAGKPTQCEVVGSSGFDVLDTATCDRVMAKALFTPSRDRRGKPTNGTYLGRIRWVMPDDHAPAPPRSEFFVRVLMTIDQTGKAIACRTAYEVPDAPPAPSKESCQSFMDTFPLAMGSEVRGSFQGPAAEAEFVTALAFTPELRARVLAPRVGYEQRALNVVRFTATKEGTLGKCAFEEQRGSARMISGGCLSISGSKFDPPFSAIDKDGVATGWEIFRVLLKTGQ